MRIVEGKLPVTPRVLLSRINRKLAPDGKSIRGVRNGPFVDGSTVMAPTASRCASTTDRTEISPQDVCSGIS